MIRRLTLLPLHHPSRHNLPPSRLLSTISAPPATSSPRPPPRTSKTKKVKPPKPVLKPIKPRPLSAVIGSQPLPKSWHSPILQSLKRVLRSRSTRRRKPHGFFKMTLERKKKLKAEEKIRRKEGAMSKRQRHKRWRVKARRHSVLGVMPKGYPPIPNRWKVFEEAARLIRQDQAERKSVIEDLRNQVASIKRSDPLSPSLESLKDTLRSQIIESQLNDPFVRYNFRKGVGPLSNPIYHHLTELNWRREGPLSLNIQRIEQMKVYPDLVPKFVPEVDAVMRVKENRWRFKGLKWKGRMRKGELRRVICGGWLDTSATIHAPPNLNVQVWHPSTRFYTILLVDPDVPSPSTSSFTTYLHLSLLNVPLSLTQSYVPLPPTALSLPVDASVDPFEKHHETIVQLRGYVPPHPQKGSDWHRYVWVVLEQGRRVERGSEEMETIKSLLPREGVNLRSLLSRFPKPKTSTPSEYTDSTLSSPVDTSVPLTLQVKGATFWRSSYSNRGGTSMVYKDILRTEEPEFGLKPKVDSYKVETGERWSRYYN